MTFWQMVWTLGLILTTPVAIYIDMTYLKRRYWGEPTRFFAMLGIAITTFILWTELFIITGVLIC